MKIRRLINTIRAAGKELASSAHDEMMRYIKATPHNYRLTALHVINLHIFRHSNQKLLDIRRYACASADDTAASPAPAAENKTDTEKTVSAEAGQADAGAAVAASDNEVKGAPAAGSVFGSGSLVMTGVLSAAGGALICFLLTRKRRS